MEQGPSPFNRSVSFHGVAAECLPRSQDLCKDLPKEFEECPRSLAGGSLPPPQGSCPEVVWNRGVSDLIGIANG